MPNSELTKISLAAPGAVIDIQLASPIENERGTITFLRIEATRDAISISSRLENGDAIETYTAGKDAFAASLSDDAVRQEFLEQWSRWAETSTTPHSARFKHGDDTEIHSPGGALIYLSPTEFEEPERIAIDVFADVDGTDLSDDEGLVASMFADNLDVPPKG